MAFLLPFPIGIPAGTPPTIYPPNRIEFLDANNQVQNARYINPTTMDYQLSSNGTFVGENVVCQQVYLAVVTTYNSAAQSNLGSKLKSIKLITPNIILKVSNIINSALANLVNQGAIEVGAVVVAIPFPNMISIQFTWTNLQTGSTNVMNLPTQGNT